MQQAQMADENMDTVLSWPEVRAEVKTLLSHPVPDRPSIILHPFQAADVFISPVGWFSRLLWRFIRFKMNWEKEPFKIYREVPYYGA